MKKCLILLTSSFIFCLFSSNLIAQQRANIKRPVNQLVATVQTGLPIFNLFGELQTESFEDTTFPPSGWKKVTNLGGTGWQRTAIGEPVPGFQDTGTQQPIPLDTTPPNGGRAVALCSWATGDADGDFQTGQATDQWLITPQIKNVQNGDTLKFYLRYFAEFGDNLDILISTAGDSIPDFDSLVTTLTFTSTSSNAWTMYSYALTDFVQSGSDIYIAFHEHVANTAANGDALFLDLAEVTSLVTAVAEDTPTPDQFELLQNYPNPFNPTTNISFTLPQSAEVTLKIYNLLGQDVQTVLENTRYTRGQHTVQFEAAHLSNGIYYYKIEASEFVAVKKMTLLK